MKDSPLDVAIIFGMDMSATLAERCLILLEKGGMLLLFRSVSLSLLFTKLVVSSPTFR